MKRFAYPIVLFGCLLVMSLASAFAQTSDTKNAQSSAAPCIECIRIRVGLPRVVQGPSPGIPDNPFTEIQLRNGRFRGFSASGTTYAIDGATPSDMTGTPVQVIPKGPAGEYGDSCQALSHVEWSGNTLLGWVHAETGDRPGQGLWSMSLVSSEDEGRSWQRLGQIITGTDQWTQGKVTGEGDCTVVDGEDGYYYAYCLRRRGNATIVARAPVKSPGPGNWKKYFNGSWSQPGLGGDSTPLAKGVGNTVARWTTTGEIVNLGAAPNGSGGLGLLFSQDHVNFTALSQPLIARDPGSHWHRPGDPHELLAYWSLIDAKTGQNQLSDHWLLSYLDIQPNEAFRKRYLVFRPVEISRSRQPDEPPVAVLLARWYNAKLHDHWSTIAAVPGNYSDYKLQAQSGYLMTAADPKRPSVELVECASQQGQHLDHILAPKGECENHGYQDQRIAGWVFSTPQPGTQALYSCYSNSDKSHFAANSEDCDHLGKKEILLGYDLKE